AVEATEAFVMKALLPLRTHSPPRSSARVTSAAASEPEPGWGGPQAPRPRPPSTEPGWVGPQAPSPWPLARGGRYRRCCSGEPKVAMWLEQSELWAHIVMPTDASPRHSSSTISAYDT